MRSEGAVEMVRRGYTEETRCLGFTVIFYDDMEGVQEAIRIIDSYNNFSANVVNDALDKLAPYRPYFGSIKVGREGSPVLYIDIDGEQDHEAVKNILHEAMADEIHFTGNTVRAWWD